MIRSALLAASLAALTSAGAHAQQAVTLRSPVEASGPSATLGDFFVDAGAAASRAVGPAPGPGRTATYSPRVVEAAARAAGLQWTAPAGMTAILVAGRGATGPNTRSPPSAQTAPSGEIAVRRGETVTLTYKAPDITLTTRARAAGDAAAGDTVRLVNLQSNRTIDATVTGPGAAIAN
jgi:flagella basal body P-ring formation protein FlgA